MVVGQGIAHIVGANGQVLFHNNPGKYVGKIDEPVMILLFLELRTSEQDFINFFNPAGGKNFYYKFLIS